MKRLILLSVAASASFAASFAACAATETYVLDSTHTVPSFSVMHFGMSTVRGLFEGSSGKVTLDIAAKTGSVEVKIPTGTVFTGYLKSTGAGRTRDEHLRAADFFNSAEFPDMVFKSTKFNFAGDKVSDVSGTLTLLGKTQPVTLKASNFNCYVSPMLKREVCGGDFETTIARSSYGMPFGINFGLPDNIRLLIQIEAIKQ